jgi:rubrerythrin
MSNKTTVAELFDLAIQCEQVCEKLYRELEMDFAHVPELSKFWDKYAREEAGHTRFLEGLRNESGEEKLSAFADVSAIERAQTALQASMEMGLRKIDDLEDAYQLAVELENSETNTVFEFLITNYSTDKHSQRFLRSQLKNHVANLTLDFPSKFNSAVTRRGVKAKG